MSAVSVYGHELVRTVNLLLPLLYTETRETRQNLKTSRRFLVGAWICGAYVGTYFFKLIHFFLFFHAASQSEIFTRLKRLNSKKIYLLLSGKKQHGPLYKLTLRPSSCPSDRPSLQLA
ncbi:hypothetical protein RRG08_060860 [Elysia crispata]|uniref:Uncharacterized protein n=1 Tax=Elysia crispata TaxID=231223 RepID=A0AAE0ZFR4_9GAST|nr:hypothetical protein RRG08_060860 [Elysia crispata]